MQGAIVFILAWLLRAPEPGETPTIAAPKVIQSAESYSPRADADDAGVLAALRHVRPGLGERPDGDRADRADRQDFDVANAVILFGGATTLTVALIVDNVANGAARPLFGWISDNIGREYTMAIAFGLGGISYWLLGAAGTAPWAFVLFAGLIFLTWGEIFSLFPSTCTDSFGPKFATDNLSLLYTAKGASAFLVPLANVIKDATGSWQMVFLVTTIMNFVVVGAGVVRAAPAALALAGGPRLPAARRRVKAARGVPEMKHSTERILTTHVGSLPRPADLLEFLEAREEGRPVDQAAFDALPASPVRDVVEKAGRRRHRQRLRRRAEQDFLHLLRPPPARPGSARSAAAPTTGRRRPAAHRDILDHPDFHAAAAPDARRHLVVQPRGGAVLHRHGRLPRPPAARHSTSTISPPRAPPRSRSRRS